MNPSKKTQSKQDLNARIKAAQEDTSFAKAVVVSMLRCPGIYAHLPKMHPENLPEVHIELAKAKDGAIIILQNGEIYHVSVGHDNWFKKAVRLVRKKINSWKKQPAGPKA